MACRRLDILFAGDHFIRDGHAKRMLDTRLGAAFTLSLPFVLGIITVQTFGANNLLVGDGLVPAKTLQPPLDASDPTLFNKIHIAVDTYALQPDIDCEQAVNWDAKLATDLKCASKTWRLETPAENTDPP